MTQAPTVSVSTEDMEQYRSELTGYCYRMLGSSFEAEDAVQDTFVRAWKSADKFEGRSSLRSWLYSIATNVCLTMSDSRKRRASPMDLGPSSTADTPIGPMRHDLSWIEPIPDSTVVAGGGDPADTAVARDSVRLAFIVALQHLPARQRAVLILCEVLHWKASEAAEFLETSVASINSALQRARATLDEGDSMPSAAKRPLDLDQEKLALQYADSFQRYDMESLASLLHQDVVMSMPPYDLWLQGADQVQAWLVGQGHGCRDSRVLATSANGCPAFGQYRKDPDGGHKAWALQVIEISGGLITGITAFLETETLFPMFDLPLRLDD